MCNNVDEVLMYKTITILTLLKYQTTQKQQRNI